MVGVPCSPLNRLVSSRQPCVYARGVNLDRQWVDGVQHDADDPPRLDVPDAARIPIIQHPHRTPRPAYPVVPVYRPSGLWDDTIRGGQRIEHRCSKERDG